MKNRNIHRCGYCGSVGGSLRSFIDYGLDNKNKFPLRVYYHVDCLTLHVEQKLSTLDFFSKIC